MSFLSPWLLLGALAAGIPIALHFFYRSRYRRVPWAAMRFLRLSIEQTSRRLRFQELFLLILRTAAFLVLPLALARPVLRTVAGEDGVKKGDAVDAILVIDASYSMAARDGITTRFERARKAALAVIDHLPAGSTAQVVRSSDRAEALGPLTPSNLGHARTILQEMNWTDEATDLYPAVLEASRLLGQGSAPNRELYVFSDMQKMGWDQQRDALVSQLQALSQKATIHLVRCGTQAVKNATLLGIAPQAGIPHVGERAAFAVLVRNHGTEPLRDLTVSLQVEGQEAERESQVIPILGAAETKAITLTCRLDQPGQRILTATIHADELDADNRFDQVIQVREQVRVLVVDGALDERDPEKSASYFLLHALRPVPETAWGSYHVQPRLVSAEQAAPALLADKDVCMLTNVSLEDVDRNGRLSQDFLQRLKEFVRDGHGLVVFAGSKVQPETYNRDCEGLLPAHFTTHAIAPTDQPWQLDPLSADGFLTGFKEEPLDRIKLVEVERMMAWERPSKDTRVLLKTTDGRPVVATRKVGDGQVVFVATSADATWSNWALLPTYLPFVHVTLGHLVQAHADAFNRRAGEPIRWRPPARTESMPYQLLFPGGQVTRLSPPTQQEDHPVFVASDTHRAGIYRINAESGTTDPEVVTSIAFALVPDLRESEDLTAWSDAQLDERLGFVPVHVTASDDPSVFSGTERLNWEGTKWLLLALLAILIVESAWAWLCGRSW